MKKVITILFLLHFCISSGYAQEKTGYTVYARVIDGDTIPVIPLDEVLIYPDNYDISYQVLKSKRASRRMTKLIKNIKKVYPYAKTAGVLMVEYEEILAGIEDPKERKRIIKEVEKELDDEFGGDLRKMTFSQGVILIKLVDRETGSSSYEIVAELRGKFRAFFYQGLARLFGYNLRSTYDPQGEDRDIENIVRMIERGDL